MDYAAALRRGREQLAQNDPKQAVLCFEAAVKARDKDPVALSELGWAIFLFGDFSRARQVSEQAAALAGDPKLRAASLYNVGRAAEAAADRTAAVTAYRQSLKLRPSAEVHARLAALDPEVFAFQENQPAPVTGGPYRSIEAFCKQWVNHPRNRCPTGFRRQWPFEGKYELENAPPVLKGISIFHTYEDTGMTFFCQVAIPIGKRVFVHELMTANDCLPLDLSIQDLGTGSSQALAIWNLDKIFEPGAGGPAQGKAYFVKRLSFCGIGRSGVPSCTLPFELEPVPESQLGDAIEPPPPPLSWEHKWRLEFDRPGTVRLTPDGWWPTDVSSLKQVGRHRLLFP